MWYPEIGGGGIEAAELLLAHGIDIDQEKFGWTTLHRCAWSGNVQFARFLLEKGANPDIVGTTFNGSHSGTPLQIARARDQAAVVELLARR